MLAVSTPVKRKRKQRLLPGELPCSQKTLGYFFAKVSAAAYTESCADSDVEVIEVVNKECGRSDVKYDRDWKPEHKHKIPRAKRTLCSTVKGKGDETDEDMTDFSMNSYHEEPVDKMRENKHHREGDTEPKNKISETSQQDSSVTVHNPNSRNKREVILLLDSDDSDSTHFSGDEQIVASLPKKSVKAIDNEKICTTPDLLANLGSCEEVVDLTGEIDVANTLENSPSKVKKKRRTIEKKTDGNKKPVQCCSAKTSCPTKKIPRNLNDKPNLTMTAAELDMAASECQPVSSLKLKSKKMSDKSQHKKNYTGYAAAAQDIGTKCQHTNAKKQEIQKEDTNKEDRCFTPDSLLEELMTSIDESNLSQESNPPFVPYYLVNFRRAMTSVLDQQQDSQYFDEEDNKIISGFWGCSEAAQKLYVRLLYRQHSWIPTTGMNYPEIASNLSPVLSELINHNLIMDNNQETSLCVLLEMLSSQKLKPLCKEYKISDTSKKRSEIIRDLVSHTTKPNISSMFKTGISTEQSMVKKVRKVIPLCYKLSSIQRAVFLRILMLYSLVFETLDPDKTRQQLLYTMLLETIGKVKYPDISVNRATPIFLRREHVIRLQTAVDLESSLARCLQRNEHEASKPLCAQAISLYKKWSNDSEMIEYDLTLPSQLVRYTCMSQIIRAISYAVDLLQKQKLYSEAVTVYEILLAQKTYCTSSRGYWYDRLALIYDYHLKDKHKALTVIRSALDDGRVRVGHRLSLYQRAERICKHKTMASVRDSVKHDDIRPAPIREITGTTVNRSLPESGRVNVFVSNESNGIRQVSVETVALNHFMKEFNLTRGLHAESSVFTSIYGLLFWDIIYDDSIPDTFWSVYQYQPLDFQTDEFYTRRREALDTRLEWCCSASSQMVLEKVERVWEENFNCCSAAVNWDIFKSAKDVHGLICCFGMKLVKKICERFIKVYRHCRSGLPDLTMWNPDTGNYKIVEVKGPNDKLSTKQILWLDFFMQHGAQAEVCYVKVAGRQKVSKGVR